METNAANDIGYYLLIDAANKADLGYLRQWSNIKIGFDGNAVWAKDLDYVQVNSTEVRTMPYKTIYYASGSKLFLLNSKLPDRNIPALLWTPIDRAIPVSLPSFNHNYFGIQEKVSVQLVPSDTERVASAVITTIAVLGQYMATAPAIRLQGIKWAILNADKVLLVGTPMLPLTGDTYWQNNNFLMPSGYDLDLHLMKTAINNQLNPDGDNLVVWNSDSSYFLVEKDDLQPLSLSSFKTSMQLLPSA